MTKRIIYGASGHGKVLADIVEQNGQSIYCFVDDDKTKWEEIFFGHEIHSPDFLFDNIPNNEFECIIAVGNCKTRERIVQKLINGVKYFKAIHPSAQIAKNVHIGEGTVVMANVVINSDSSIGNHCIINTSSSIDHDCFIQNFVHISPGVHLGGRVQIGDLTWIGLGASIVNNINIGENTIVGAGAVVIHDVDQHVVVAGNPAKYLRKNL